MSTIVTFLTETSNIPESTVMLLLMLPIVATLISFIRNVIGLKTFGIYAPIVLTFAYYELGVIGENDVSNLISGLKYGLTLTIIVFISAALSHLITRKVRLHYLPKMSIVLGFVAFTVLGALALGSTFDKIGFISVDILPLLLIITVAEQFISLYIKKGGKSAVVLSIYTVLGSVFAYSLISFEAFQDLILRYPWISVLTLLLNIVIGKWTGLRVSEYFRFDTIFSSDGSSTDSKE